jgi:hypothetical protein
VLKELFRLNLYNFGLGLPALAGVALGIRLYSGGPTWRLAAGVLLLLSWAVMVAGRLILKSHTSAGAWLIESWIASAVLVTAFVTNLVLFLTLSEWFPAILGNASGKTLEKLSDTLVGAVTAFTALVWTKDIADAKGYFWPSTQFKYGLEALYERLAKKPEGGTVEYDAIFMETVANRDIEGWSFPSRRARAKIVADYLARNP